MKPWIVKFINASAEQELLSLSADLKAKFLHIVELLQEFGPQNIGLPHVRPLKNKLWELRLKGKDNIGRSIYILGTGRKIIILHTFIKKTQQTPPKALKIAEARLKELTHD
jgi:phage-related protein